MSFKEDVKNELSSTFLNLDEFGELSEIAGHNAVRAVQESLELDLPPSASDARLGVEYEGITLYVADSDIPEMLKTQKETSFNGEKWFVLSCARDCGLKIIQLYRERA